MKKTRATNNPCFFVGSKLNSLDKYGQNINIVISLKNKNKDEISVISGWKVNPEGYITCNTPYGDRWWKNTM